MRRLSMLRAWTVPVCAALGMLPAAMALAQDQPQYETPRYQPQPSAPPDKNFGLPSFGMPGAELPQQKTMAPERAPDPSAVPNFFADTTEIPVPGGPAGTKDAETPLFTTSDGSTMASVKALPDDSDTSSDDTTEAQKVGSR